MNDFVIRNARVVDVRFPTSRESIGSDAVNKDPDYSAAYCILETSDVSSGVAGTTFKIFLPAIPQPVTGAASRPAEPVRRGGTERILVVEDDAAVRTLTKRILETFGYRVWEAGTGVEALELWRHHFAEIDLLVTDIIMPDGITGHDLAKQLRAQKPGLGIIFVSGYSSEVVGKDTDFLHATKSHFLQKPYPSHLLLDTVRKCLDEK